jgi:hypothetical protein
MLQIRAHLLVPPPAPDDSARATCALRRTLATKHAQAARAGERSVLALDLAPDEAVDVLARMDGIEALGLARGIANLGIRWVVWRVLSGKNVVFGRFLLRKCVFLMHNTCF